MTLPSRRRAQAIARRLLAWYSRHARDLPWRRTRDPYAIWVSEIMLQQTQVDTVRPYYRRWMEAFPTVVKLAAASLDDVLRLWEGLGYYSRARNLKSAAARIVAERDGVFPSSIEEIRSLPGVGPYTAAAIGSIAFNLDAAVVDGNVKRVLARVCGYREDVKTPRGLRDLQSIADRILPPGHASAYNQAVMDLGATICTPRRPACDRCPLNSLCVARQAGTQDTIPVTTRRVSPAQRQALIAVVQHGDDVWVLRRNERLLGGLWAFPSIEVLDPASSLAEEQLQAELARRLRQMPEPFITLVEKVQHTYTHFRLTARVVRCRLRSPAEPVDDSLWVSLDQLADLPMGRIDRAVATALAAGQAVTKHNHQSTT